MKLEIIDNNYELQQAFEKTAKSVEADLKASRRKDVKRRFAVTMGFIITVCSILLITSAIFFPPNVKWWMLVFSYISILAYALIFAFVDIAPTKNKNEQIEKAEREQYGELFDIIQEVNAGNIIAAEVDSISMEQSVPTLELCLECKDGYFGRKLLFFKPVLTMSRDKKYAGALSVDLQSGQAICYFKDAVTTAETLELPEKVLRKGR